MGRQSKQSLIIIGMTAKKEEESMTSVAIPDTLASNRGEELVFCPNAPKCGAESMPQWVLDCNGGRCIDCNVCFAANLSFFENDECPICFEDNVTTAKLPQCQHKMCLACIRKNVHREDARTGDFLQEPIVESCPLCRAQLTRYWENRRG